MLALVGYVPDDVYLTTGPLYHSGPGGFMGVAHALGNTVVLQRKFDAEDWLRLVETYRVTTTFSAPTPIRLVCNLPAEVKAKYDRSSMQRMIANAAPWSFALKQAYLADFPAESLFEVYGSTELGVDTVLRPEDQLRKPGSCGQPAPGVEIRLFDDDGNEVTEAERARRALRAQRRACSHVPQGAGEVRGGPARRLPHRRRRRVPRRGGLLLHLRPQEGHDHLGRHEHLSGRDRGRARAPPRHLRRRGVRHPERGVGRERARRRGAAPGAALDEEASIAFAREHLAGYKVPALGVVHGRAAAHRLGQDPEARAARAVLGGPRHAWSADRASMASGWSRAGSSSRTGTCCSCRTGGATARVDWSPPGGVVEIAEGERVVDGLTREVEEETGLRVTAWEGPVYQVDAEAPDMGWHLRVEVHRAVAFEGELDVDDPDEHRRSTRGSCPVDALDDEVATMWLPTHEPLGRLARRALDRRAARSGTASRAPIGRP